MLLGLLMKEENKKKMSGPQSEDTASLWMWSREQASGTQCGLGNRHLVHSVGWGTGIWYTVWAREQASGTQCGLENRHLVQASGTQCGQGNRHLVHSVVWGTDI